MFEESVGMVGAAYVENADVHRQDADFGKGDARDVDPGRGGLEL